MHDQIEAVFAHWQKIVQAQLLWLQVIGDDFGVDISLSFYEQKYFAQDSERYSHLAIVLPEIIELRAGVNMLYTNISITRGDPSRVQGRYRVADDLMERTSTEALIQIGLACIDTVLIGPPSRASALLATDTRLYSNALTRARCIREDCDVWLPRVQQAIAGADAMLARCAIDAAMKEINANAQ